MSERKDKELIIRGASEHNLQDIDLTIPRGRLVVVTGVSGSGKSSLAFDTIYREGQRRFLETMPSYARSFLGQLSRPKALSLEGLGPAIAVGQRVGVSNPRSTVGTICEVYDLLRLLFARLGTTPSGTRPTRALFSFNSAQGACPTCQGLGVMDRLDPDLIVADPAKSIRHGALRVSTPNGYLMYSQVTLAVLDEVLRAHGGDVDTPWQNLSQEVRGVVYHGSTRLKVPFGKHPLESRMKWSGITARPRQEGFYRGLVPIMEEILRGKRNDSILRFVKTAPCSACGGARLCPEALGVRLRGATIAEVAHKRASQLRSWLADGHEAGLELAVLAPIRQELVARCDLMEELGLGYLEFDRSATTLSVGEAQRLRLMSLVLGELRGLVVVLDEPSAGLHPHDTGRLLGVLRRLARNGQTVIVVEHDPLIIRAADWLVDLGPGPGGFGGRLLWNGPPSELMAAANDGLESPTRTWLRSSPSATAKRPGNGLVAFDRLVCHNLEEVDVELLRQGLNLVTGVSGAGKSSLLTAIVERLRSQGNDHFRRIVTVDAEPIGRTPRSNPATYSGAFDSIRDLFASTAAAQARSFTKGHFSFNTAGGRCEACEGAGAIDVGMRYLGSVALVCEACGGRRFHPEILEVLYRDRSIADVLESSIAEAAQLFADHSKLRRILGELVGMGLGYLRVGQPATGLSGGEAQRVKLATELAKTGRDTSLFVLDEPSTGLHAADLHGLLASWDRLLAAGHTILAADNDVELVRAADRIIDLGPGSGPDGGRVVFQGSVEQLEQCPASLTGVCLRAETLGAADPLPAAPLDLDPELPPMSLRGVSTHNLCGVDVDIPSRGLTVVTGPSGCGKSSLVFDSLLAEAQNRFSDLVAPWARRFLSRQGGAQLETAQGLQAAVAVPHHVGRRNPRSTVGTASDIDERLRLLFSRAGSTALWAGAFSPNTEAGACPACKGLGFIQKCDPDRLIAHPQRPLHEGALHGTRFGAYLGEADGQHMATLNAAAAALGLDLSAPWSSLGPRERALALEGADDRVFEVVWKYKRGKRQGEHRFESGWPGLLALVEREHERIHAEAKGESLAGLLRDATCPSCLGERLRPEPRAVVFAGQRLPEVSSRTLSEIRDWLTALEADPVGLEVGSQALAVSQDLRRDISRQVGMLIDAGIGYLSLDREVASLSGGEFQRLRLASALGGGLVGITYALDEPTQGLHPRDVERLCQVLRALADAGNAVVVVEHDPALATQADWIIELGPGAGPEGGRITAQGPPARLSPETYTGRLLHQQRDDTRSAARVLRPGVTVKGARYHNLRDLTVSLPLGALVAVTGVSGSGKSTLVHQVLGPSIAAKLQGRGAVHCRDIELHADVRSVESLGGAWSSAGGQSTVATLCGMADVLRKRFAATPQAKERRLTAKHFSTANPGGRCEACEGRGVITVAMDLLPNVTVGCESCGGRRFQPQVLECALGGYDIAALLEAPITEVVTRFAADLAFGVPLSALENLGLGYLRLGQEAKTLSAGELQRVRLALLLARSKTPTTAVLLDEPTRGLGFEDVGRLIQALHRLADAGHMVVAVEHDLDFIAAADWVVDLGPEGGPGGGQVVVEGRPGLVRSTAASHTGQALARRRGAP